MTQFGTKYIETSEQFGKPIYRSGDDTTTALKPKTQNQQQSEYSWKFLSYFREKGIKGAGKFLIFALNLLLAL